ncbi:hypothetical protein B0O80DRAFT_164951 [Mortierella sp. GBAus27b]|nr:hypothetical protein B0O80DRAFT_164951 [Mortierella sp. GBAus27b]
MCVPKSRVQRFKVWLERRQAIAEVGNDECRDEGCGMAEGKVSTMRMKVEKKQEWKRSNEVQSRQVAVPPKKKKLWIFYAAPCPWHEDGLTFLVFLMRADVQFCSTNKWPDAKGVPFLLG